jgi:hypothetical protein
VCGENDGDPVWWFVESLNALRQKRVNESLLPIVPGNTHLFHTSWLQGGRAYPVSCFSGGIVHFVVMLYLRKGDKSLFFKCYVSRLIATILKLKILKMKYRFK